MERCPLRARCFDRSVDRCIHFAANTLTIPAVPFEYGPNRNRPLGSYFSALGLPEIALRNWRESLTGRKPMHQPIDVLLRDTQRGRQMFLDGSGVRVLFAPVPDGMLYR